MVLLFDKHELFDRLKSFRNLDSALAYIENLIADHYVQQLKTMAHLLLFLCRGKSN